MVIAIIMLLAICVALIIALCQKVSIDKETKKENEEMALINARLKDKNKNLANENKYYTLEIKHKSDTKDALEKDLNNIRANIRISIDQNKEISQKAFEEYQKNLEESYRQIESMFDIKVAGLEMDRRKAEEELEKIKATRAAALESLLKEQEVKDNKDNYRLIPSESDLADSRKLELVKKELNKPRILCMLIWQTYWQPLAKKQFPQILQAKTKCGIYKITNQITDECYIGQAVDVYKRWCEHCKCGLGIDTPPGNKLYKAIQEYGLDNFTFELITECSTSELNEKEKYFIELYQADTFGYNGQGGNK